MAYHYGSFFSLIPAARFRSNYLLLAFLLLSGLSWGQCFNPPINTTARHGSIAIGDFNGDGKPDFVTTQYGTDSLAIFLNKGNGFFDTGAHFFVGQYADSLAVGDLNGDGKLDVATTAHATYHNSNSVAVLLGDGKGGLATSTYFNEVPGDYGNISVLISDINADGFADLVTTSLYDSVTVLLNDGRAGFGEGSSYSAGKSTQIRRTRTGDFNGDGKPDLILLPDNRDDYFVSLLLNNGRGGFVAPIPIRDKVFSYASAMEISDFNNDGRPDVVVVGDSLAILLNNGANGFTINRMTNPSKGIGYAFMAVGNFNNDSKPDLALPGSFAYSGPPSYTNLPISGQVLLGKGDGFFVATPTQFGFRDENIPYREFLPGDFNTDGQTDLLSILNGTISVLLNCAFAPKLTLNDSQTATVCMPFAYTVNAFTSAKTPSFLTYSASLNPANGLSFDPTTRLISGTPSLSGVTSVTITATDPAGLNAATSFTITAQPPIILGVDEPGTDISVSPNPATDLVQITVNNAYRGPVSVRLLSVGGQAVRAHTSVKTAEIWQHTLSVQGMPAGHYYISLQQDGQQTSRTLLRL